MSKVVDYDIEASNGVIHVVDSVILPPDLTPSALTIAEIAAADEDFETLVAAATAANLVGTLNDPMTLTSRCLLRLMLRLRLWVKTRFLSYLRTLLLTYSKPFCFITYSDGEW